MLRALSIEQSLYSSDDIHLAGALGGLGNLYDAWGKPDKSESYDRLLLAVLEKQIGPNSFMLAPILASEAKALRALGRNDEAASVEARMNALPPPPVPATN
jgi:tetratricopeptide (TPR) repeat protein